MRSVDLFMHVSRWGNAVLYLFQSAASSPMYWIGEVVMSQHASLRGANKIMTKRNVLKRFERIDILKHRGKWKAGDRGLGLPKTKSES